MNYRDDLKLKYLIGVDGVLPHEEEFDCTSIVLALVNEIKGSRRTKKNWSSKNDFVFDSELSNKVVDQASWEYAILNNLVEEISENSYIITEKGLSLIFNLK